MRIRFFKVLISMFIKHRTYYFNPKLNQIHELKLHVGDLKYFQEGFSNQWFAFLRSVFISWKTFWDSLNTEDKLTLLRNKTEIKWLLYI